MWALFSIHVNFPLSTLLAGTEAVAQSPKVERLGHESGTIYEFPKVEAHVEGNEKIGDLDCVRVRVDRWHYTRDIPATYLLWLAVERNYICAKFQAMGRGDQMPKIAAEASVEAWEEPAPGIWLPAKISVAEYTLRENKAAVDQTRTLTLESTR